VVCIKKTLADKLKNFSTIKVKNASVKVPKLDIRKKAVSNRKKLATTAKDDKIPVSSIIDILIKTAVDNAKKEGKEKSGVEESKTYAISKEDAKIKFEGYGNSFRRYETAPRTPYVNYEKLFSYLGKFKAQSPFENFASDNPTERINKVIEQGNKFYLIDNEVRDDAVRSIKYFTHGAVMGEQAVPTGKINSADWEKFKIWKLVSYVEFNLKMQTL